MSLHPSPLTPLPHHAIGVMGGTFDPIHLGHLRLAEEMAEALDLDQVRFIPAGQPPHRDMPRTSALHRLEMVRRAVAGNPRFTVDAREVEQPAPSYTVDTLTALRAELGSHQPLWLLLGADAFAGLPAWHRWQQLFALAHIAVATRPGSNDHTTQPDTLAAELKQELSHRQVPAGSATGPAGAVVLQNMTALDISASRIRAILARQGSARYLLPDAVLDYIHQHQLYPHS
ncbi:nicotinate-nucleotide adenylyltransferase [Thiobacillus sp.]|uniref:nicotinate-nucleotide adenylyltransferase n=1 Tax=Thiobacillus sp. TaxID=924 RepID=UPI00286E35AD|nr:nicotinate-nucleotide adenylyltransferase [Thiobacillus sp.]